MTPIQHTLRSVIGWLRAGYPQGVPNEDTVALLEILRRRLSDEEIVEVADQLASDDPERIHLDEIRAALRSATKQSADEGDVRRVSALLAAAGWPLSQAPVEEAPQDERGSANVVRRFVDWVRVGYPTGVPPQDCPPLVALLSRRLPDDEVDEVCHALRDAGLMPPSRVDIGVEITKAIDDVPTPTEIERVMDRLMLTGWAVRDESHRS